MISESMDSPMSSSDNIRNNSEQQTKPISVQPNDAKIIKVKTKKSSKSSHQQPAKLNEISNKDKEEQKRKLLQHGNKTAGQLLVKDSNCKKVSTAKTGNNGASNRKEKKRYEETIIDGVAICAFKTWEDLQDETNEQATINRSTSKHKDHVKASHRSLPASKSKLVPDPKPKAKSKTTSSPAQSNHVIVDKVRVANQGGNSGDRDESFRYKNKKPQDDHRTLTAPVDHSASAEAVRAKQEADKHYSSMQEKLEQDRMKKMRYEEKDNNERHHLRPEIKQIHQQQTRESAKDGFETLRYPSSYTNQSNPSHQAHNESIYLNKPTICYQHNVPSSSQSRNEFENRNSHWQQSSSYHPAPPPMQPQMSAVTRDHHPMNQYTPHYQQPPITPSIVQMNNTNNQYSQQQYFNSPQQFYQQHSRDSQQSHQQSQMPPVNHPYVPPFVHPPAPPCNSLIGQSSLPASYNSPYTITDTIISRKTSIITPAMEFFPLPGDRYGNYPQPYALYPNQGPGYVPSATERSFMEYTRNYTNASNMNNFMKSSSASSPLGNYGIGNMSGGLNSNFNRFGMDNQRMSSGLPLPLPDPMMSRFGLPSYNIDTRSAISASSFYPPHPFR